MFSFFVSEVLKKIILLMLWECEVIIHAFFLNGVNNELFRPFMSNSIYTSWYTISNSTTNKISCSSDSLHNFMEG